MFGLPRAFPCAAATTYVGSRSADEAMGRTRKHTEKWVNKAVTIPRCGGHSGRFGAVHIVVRSIWDNFPAAPRHYFPPAETGTPATTPGQEGTDQAHRRPGSCLCLYTKGNTRLPPDHILRCAAAVVGNRHWL